MEERGTSASWKAWFAMEETRERNSKGKAKMKVNTSGIYSWVKKMIY
jgi:hypothetical protein